MVAIRCYRNDQLSGDHTRTDLTHLQGNLRDDSDYLAMKCRRYYLPGLFVSWHIMCRLSSVTC